MTSVCVFKESFPQMVDMSEEELMVMIDTHDGVIADEWSEDSLNMIIYKWMMHHGPKSLCDCEKKEPSRELISSIMTFSVMHGLTTVMITLVECVWDVPLQGDWDLFQIARDYRNVPKYSWFKEMAEQQVELAAAVAALDRIEMMSILISIGVNPLQFMQYNLSDAAQRMVLDRQGRGF